MYNNVDENKFCSSSSKTKSNADVNVKFSVLTLCSSVFQAIVLCFRLHFTKDNITNNTAAATVRQVVTVVFERMVAEDDRFKGQSRTSRSINSRYCSDTEYTPHTVVMCSLITMRL